MNQQHFETSDEVSFPGFFMASSNMDCSYNSVPAVNRKMSSNLETPKNLRRKRFGGTRSVTVDATTSQQNRKLSKLRDCPSEISSISSIFTNDFVRLGNNRYGKLLTRENTVDSDYYSAGNQRLSSLLRGDSARVLNGLNETSFNETLSQHSSQKLLPENQSIPDENTPLSGNPPYAVPLLIENNKANTKLRIVKRRSLFNKRKMICDVSVGLAFVGMFIMMLDMEIGNYLRPPNERLDWENGVPWLLKFLVVTLTLGLVAATIAYQVIEIEIFLMENGAEDWRVAISAKRITIAILEVLICSICPLPGLDHVKLSYQDPISRSTPACGVPVEQISSVPLNVLLSIPMFARSYLLCRAMVLHSRQFQDILIWSIAPFNHVTVNFKFVTKVLLSEHPLMVLCVFTMTTCCCAAWMFTQCEKSNRSCGQMQCHSYFDSLWLVTVTLLAIGYGDVVPHTYCGRFVAILAGVAGMVLSAAVISVMSSRVGLAKQEKQVNNFVTDSKLASGFRNAAATVLQETWFIHKYKTKSNVNSKVQVIRHQRKFLNAIHRFRVVKLAQRKLWERQFEFVDLRRTQHEVQETVLEMQKEQKELLMNSQSLVENIAEVNEALKAEMKTRICNLEYNQEILMTDMNVIQGSLGDIQIQLSSIVTNLSNQMQTNGGL